MGSLQEVEEQQHFFLPPSDPVVIELNRLHNHLQDKNRELGDALGEIKALKITDALKNKAVEELSNELTRLEEKLRTNKDLLESKNIEIEKLKHEKKEALAAQYAAEATLRRVYASQKDEDFVPVGAIIAPLEADIKMYKNEIAALREDKKALERITKSQESALIEAERILRSALERALIVEEVQNQNMDLKRQIEICQEENRILDKTNRQKVSEVEKLSQSIMELEEALLAGGAAANTVRDYRRQIAEVNEEKKILERELARAKVLANRVATVVSNDWKDDNDKVMPVKQWLEERRFMQAEMQRLKDKLIVSERTAKSEAQLKEKFKLRLKTLEEGLKHTSTSHNTEQTEKSSPISGFVNYAGPKKRSTSQPRGSVVMRKGSPLRQPVVGTEAISASGQLKRVGSFKMKHVGGESMPKPKQNLWACRSKLHDTAGKENTELKANVDFNMSKYTDSEMEVAVETKTRCNPDVNAQNKGPLVSSAEDVVSGFLYDGLQKEVINLRRLCEEKDANLNAKDEEIKMLMWKVDALAKAIEVESRKLKREVAARDKDVVMPKADNSNKQKMQTANFTKRASSQSERPESRG
ncbi:hypothetical protein AQUCO_00500288v1 [Aquilegia coerulea]|uniref:Uncharacterized protein n=1 Tax=Aquilegia coerulea TaxID=218851 RepID=A0A2G5ER66_AQUCA|nr:hypothetical protein AQUCO_00500288v1 [Aquilegia coerulea]